MKVEFLILLLIINTGTKLSSAEPIFFENDPGISAVWKSFQHARCVNKTWVQDFVLTEDCMETFKLFKSKIAEDMARNEIKRLLHKKLDIQHEILAGDGVTIIYLPGGPNPQQNHFRIQNHLIVERIKSPSIIGISIGSLYGGINSPVFAVLIEALPYPEWFPRRQELFKLPVDTKAQLMANEYASNHATEDYKHQDYIETLEVDHGIIVFTTKNKDEAIKVLGKSSQHPAILRLKGLEADGALQSVSISAVEQRQNKFKLVDKFSDLTKIKFNRTGHWILVFIYKWTEVKPISPDESKLAFDVINNAGLIGLPKLERYHPLAQKVAEYKACRPFHLGDLDYQVDISFGLRCFILKSSTEPYNNIGVANVLILPLKKQLRKDMGLSILSAGFALRTVQQNEHNRSKKLWHLYAAFIVLEKPVNGFGVNNLDILIFNAKAMILAAERQALKTVQMVLGESLGFTVQAAVGKNGKFDRINRLLTDNIRLGFTVEGSTGGIWPMRSQIVEVQVICTNQGEGYTLHGISTTTSGNERPVIGHLRMKNTR